MPDEAEPTGLPEVDRLAGLERPALADYVTATSAYVRSASTLTERQKKAAQIRMSATLARVLLNQLRELLPSMGPNASAGERDVAGGLRTAKEDIAEMHPLDGLRLAIELKPVHLAVGRAIWNRFGDIRMTAVNLHLKFPFAVVGGVMTIPTYEETKTKGGLTKKSTTHLISRAVTRLERAGGRETEADAPHLLEGVCVLVFDPDTATIDPELPPPDSPLRWENFVNMLATTYMARFE